MFHSAPPTQPGGTATQPRATPAALTAPSMAAPQPAADHPSSAVHLDPEPPPAGHTSPAVQLVPAQQPDRVTRPLPNTQPQPNMRNEATRDAPSPLPPDPCGQHLPGKTQKAQRTQALLDALLAYAPDPQADGLSYQEALHARRRASGSQHPDPQADSLSYLEALSGGVPPS